MAAPQDAKRSPTLPHGVFETGAMIIGDEFTDDADGEEDDTKEGGKGASSEAVVVRGAASRTSMVASTPTAGVTLTGDEDNATGVCIDESTDEGNNAVKGRGEPQDVNDDKRGGERLGRLEEIEACGRVNDEPDNVASPRAALEAVQCRRRVARWRFAVVEGDLCKNGLFQGVRRVAGQHQSAEWWAWEVWFGTGKGNGPIRTSSSSKRTRGGDKKDPTKSVLSVPDNETTCEKCPSCRHALLRFASFSRQGHSCDRCDAVVVRGAAMSRCLACDYDVCAACIGNDGIDDTDGSLGVFCTSAEAARAYDQEAKGVLGDDADTNFSSSDEEDEEEDEDEEREGTSTRKGKKTAAGTKRKGEIPRGFERLFEWCSSPCSMPSDARSTLAPGDLVKVWTTKRGTYEFWDGQVASVSRTTAQVTPVMPTRKDSRKVSIDSVYKMRRDRQEVCATRLVGKRIRKTWSGYGSLTGKVIGAVQTGNGESVPLWKLIAAFEDNVVFVEDAGSGEMAQQKGIHEEQLSIDAVLRLALPFDDEVGQVSLVDGGGEKTRNQDTGPCGVCSEATSGKRSVQHMSDDARVCQSCKCTFHRG
jgi:hypothetical protein